MYICVWIIFFSISPACPRVIFLCESQRLQTYMYNLKCQSEGTSAVCGRRIYLLKFIGHHSVWRQNCPRRRKYKSSSYPKARKIFYFRCENSPFFFHFFFYFFFSVLILSAMILIFFIHELWTCSKIFVI